MIKTLLGVMLAMTIVTKPMALDETLKETNRILQSWSPIENAVRAEQAASTATTKTAEASASASAAATSASESAASAAEAKNYRDGASAIVTPDGLAAKVLKNSDDIVAERTYADNTFLPKRGGTMTGSIVIESPNSVIRGKNNESYLSIWGGTQTNGGAYINLSGKDSSFSPGCFRLVALDSEQNTVLTGKPNGELVWGGKNLCSIEDYGGNYVKFSNGLLMCFGHIETASSTAVTFPSPFVSKPSLILTNVPNSGISCAYETLTATVFTAMGRATSGAAQNFKGNYFAVGFWK